MFAIKYTLYSELQSDHCSLAPKTSSCLCRQFRIFLYQFVTTSYYILYKALSIIILLVPEVYSCFRCICFLATITILVSCDKKKKQLELRWKKILVNINQFFFIHFNALSLSDRIIIILMHFCFYFLGSETLMECIQKEGLEWIQKEGYGMDQLKWCSKNKNYTFYSKIPNNFWNKISYCSSKISIWKLCINESNYYK